jgi:hypothetical protein
MSTPNAVGKIMETIAAERKIDVLGVDIGGATTDVFSVFGGVYNRTVSANLGMSYSICNVLTEAGLDNIARWLPFDTDPASLRNQLRNKMIRPTTIPQTIKDLQIEQAVCREALRLAFDHHKSLARGLKGVQQRRSISDAVSQSASGSSLVNMMQLDMVVGSGGVLSHAPDRAQSALMMMDAYQPEGVTMLAVDSIFMMPQLGVLSEILPEAATYVFEKDCLIKLGHCIAPVGTAKEGDPCITVALEGSDPISVKFGEMKVIPMPADSPVKATLNPARGFNVGEGNGKTRTVSVEGGVVGLIIDGRGRPLALPDQTSARTAKIVEWLNAFGLFAG